MITRLKRRFIILAMTSLAVLLAVIVTGMNTINYNTVVSNADETLDMLSENMGRLPDFFSDDRDDYYDDYFFFRGGPGRGDRGRRGMSRDEAEETRYFSVLVSSSGQAVNIDTERIFAVDQGQAAEYAESIAQSGQDRGFIDDYRYTVTEEGRFTRVTFLDCGRTLGSFRDFLKASILMSVIGLLIVFAVICYFAGRIVRPVAESYEKQKRFITDAGHEIKTPLAIIKANLDVMKMDVEDAAEALPDDEADKFTGDLNESINDVSAQVDRLTALTNDLVYLSRMEEAGGGSLVMTDIPLSEVVSDAADSFIPLAKENGKSIKTDIAPVISVRGSLNELEKLISILLENAVKYSADQDEIGVSLKKDGRNAVLEVRNRTESPIDAGDLEHVFERFYRTDRSRSSETGGHGIGLSMASAIVNAHGGKIKAGTTDGSDFVITASLPLAN